MLISRCDHDSTSHDYPSHGCGCHCHVPLWSDGFDKHVYVYSLRVGVRMNGWVGGYKKVLAVYDVRRGN